MWESPFTCGGVGQGKLSIKVFRGFKKNVSLITWNPKYKVRRCDDFRLKFLIYILFLEFRSSFGICGWRIFYRFGCAISHHKFFALCICDWCHFVYCQVSMPTWPSPWSPVCGTKCARRWVEHNCLEFSVWSFRFWIQHNLQFEGILHSAYGAISGNSDSPQTIYWLDLLISES